MAGGGGDEISLEFTPTWVVALVCAVMVAISLVVERFLHVLGKYLKKNDQKPLYEALLKVKEELMLLGFISLMLVVFQGVIQSICIPPGFLNHMTPCSIKENVDVGDGTAHFQTSLSSGGLRRLLAAGGSGSDICTEQGKVPLLSLGALHQLHIFIFILAITHVIFSVINMVLGSIRIRQWKHWEDAIQNDSSQSDPNKVTHVHELKFINDHFKGFGKDSEIVGWMNSFVKQFYGSVTRTDYTTLRLGFIMTHCRGNLKLNFHKYMVRALEADFKKVIGISWFLWSFVIIFLLVNVKGGETNFIISFLPLIILLAVGTKLEHVIIQLAHEVAEKHAVIEGDLVVKPSDDHFWFGWPRFVLHSIHFILFQIAFEFAYFFWILTTFGFDSCMMGEASLVIIKLIIGAAAQLLCSYSTLPLYAIVTQMGSSFKKAIFDEHVQEGLVGWAKKVKHRKAVKPNVAGPKEGTEDVLLQNMDRQMEICEESPRTATRNGSRIA